MCSQPMVQEAQLFLATDRLCARFSADSMGASAKVADWKLRVGRVLIALNANRFASVPSSRYFAVAGPKERSRRSLAAASTASRSATVGRVRPCTATALMFFAPITAPRPPRPACRPS